MNKEIPVEAEMVNEQAVAVRPAQSGITTISDMEQSFALAVRQRELLSDYIKKQLVPGKHFYQRGDQKPSLAKEGAEIILLPHNLAPDYEIVSGPEQPPESEQPYQITVKCVLKRKGDPTSFAGSGIGSAGSHKGYWEKSGPNKGKWMYQPRQTDKFLCHNATMKMAQKSAMIAATINSTAASEFFTQDMDEQMITPSTNVPQNVPQDKNPAAVSMFANTKTLQKMIGVIGEAKERAIQFCIDLGWLMPNEGLLDLPLRFVPVTEREMKSFMECLKTWELTGKVGTPYLPHLEPETKGPKVEVPRENVDQPGDQDKWRQFPMPFGKNAGVMMEDLDKKYLYGLWANYTVETEYNGKPKRPETIAKDTWFREMLDLAGDHYKFEKKD